MRRPPAHFRLERTPWTSRLRAARPLPKSIPRWEFIALCAALMALNALAIDIMLPALQQIGASLGVENENHRQYVITAYFAGMAFALLGYGPASDTFGRRKPLLFGLSVYLLAAGAAAFAPNFETLLVLRFIQGIGAASTRVIAISVVRDRFGGRQMAEIMSLVFMVFMIIPVIAPSLGQVVMLIGNWHLIFMVDGGDRAGDLDLGLSAPARDPASGRSPALHACLRRPGFRHGARRRASRSGTRWPR